ncbi:MAG: hypothetical protein JW918_05220 [Anaerolineae bacterium]|nr:hypothetical protein [Anaerolineae bacterium]
MRWFKALVILLVLILATACVSLDATPTPGVITPATYPAPAVSTVSNKLGVHLLLDDGRNVWPVDVWSLHLEYARRAVGEWGYVTQLVRLDDLDPVRWQHFMDLCAEWHLTPILRLATTYDREAGRWDTPLRDSDGAYHTIAARYAGFVAALRWPTADHYIIVGNEPNHGNEWGGRPDPEAYARFLIDVADALHAADASARVLNAGFDPYAPNTGDQPFADGMGYVDEETFLDRMHAAYPDVFDRLDAWASHAYPMGPFTEGPWVQAYRVDLINDAVNPDHVEPPPGVYNRGVNGYEWELFKLSTYGVEPLPVFITETGWRHAGADDEALPDAETVAVYIDLTLRGNGGRYPEYPEEGWTPWLDDPRVAAVTFFALDGFPAEWEHTNWLALDAEGNVLSTYAPFELLASGDIRP